MDRVRFAAFAVVAVAASLLSVPASATERRPATGSDIRELDRTRFTLDGKPLPERPHHRGDTRPQARAARAVTPPVGTERQWLGLDDITGKFYPKKFKLRAVGRHVEVWVALDLAFPKDDCRGNATVITDGQVAGLVKEFDEKIYPKETAAFSTPPDRDGTKATHAGDYTGAGDKTVTLIDNIRDDNFFEYPERLTYVAGFFSPNLNELFDRNVMTIDAYDWAHRTGPDPADEPTDDLCTTRPARPRMYEGTFAHEWQHLLEYYADPDEEAWLNEGLSDFAQSLVGYTDGRATVYDRRSDNHLVCFQGWAIVKTANNHNPRKCGGPQNSLNLWDEGEAGEALADYGNAFQFLLYLSDRFGLDKITMLHQDGLRNGLAAVQAVLPTGTNVYDVLHDYQTMTLVDKIVGEGGGGTMLGVPIARVTAPSVRSTVNLDNPAAYDMPGAAPNGADYVPLRTPLRSVEFSGDAVLPPKPTGWTVVDEVLFSGNTDGLDSHALLPVTVPAGSPVLTLQTTYDIEESYDFGYVTVSTDGGRTFQAIPGDRTGKGPLGPGLTGTSGKPVTATYSLKSFAGRKVLLGLRYVSDPAVNQGGWLIGKVSIGGRTLSDGSNLDGWKSPSELVRTPVHRWHVRLVGIDGATAQLVPVEQFAMLNTYPRVVAIVSYDEPTEKLTQYAPYRLVVNGVLQPGGR